MTSIEEQHKCCEGEEHEGEFFQMLHCKSKLNWWMCQRKQSARKRKTPGRSIKRGWPNNFWVKGSGSFPAFKNVATALFQTFQMQNAVSDGKWKDKFRRENRLSCFG